MPVEDFLWVLTVVALKDAIKLNTWDVQSAQIKCHCINTVTFSKRNDFGHYLNDCCSDFHLRYYIIIYEVVSHVFSDSCWVSEPCKQPPLMMADLTDGRSDTDPCVNITDTPRENLWSSMGLSVKHALKGKED